MSSKIFNSRNITIAVAVILVAALVAGLIVVTLPKADNAKGVISADNAIPEGRVNYSLATEGRFKRDVSVFLENMANSFLDIMFSEDAPHNVTVNNSSALSGVLLDIFSRAGISSEKLIKLGSFLAGLNADEAATEIILFFLDFEETEDSSEVVQATFASPDKIFRALVSDVDYEAAAETLVSATTLTREEGARLIYEGIYHFADNDRKTVMDAMGRSRFVGIFVAVSTVYESYLTFNVKGGTLAAARTAAGLAYQIGAELTELLNEVGAETVLKAIGLGETDFEGSAIEEIFGENTDISTIPEASKMNAVFTAGSNLAEFMLYCAASGFSATDNMLFESLSKQYDTNNAVEARRWKYLHHVRLASAISEGIKAGYASDKVKDKDALAATLAEVKVCMEALDSSYDPAVGDALRAKYTAAFSEYISRVTDIGASYGNITSYDELATTFTEEDYIKISDYIEFVSDFEEVNELDKGGENFIGTVVINMVFNVMADVLKNAVGK